MTRLRTLILSAPMLLALAACNAEETGEGPLQGEPVAEVAPPEGGSWSATVVRTEEGGWKVGNPAAPITLVEYGSLTCPACVAFSVEGSAKLHADYIESGRVSYEFRSAPIHGWPDLLMTRLIECAPVTSGVALADQVWGNYEPIMTSIQAGATQAEQAMAMPENQKFVALSQAAGITDFFAARGVSADQAQACLADSAAVEGLAERLQGQMQADEVQATPTFILNGQKLEDTRWNAIEAALQRAGAR